MTILPYPKRHKFLFVSNVIKTAINNSSSTQSRATIGPPTKCNRNGTWLVGRYIYLYIYIYIYIFFFFFFFFFGGGGVQMLISIETHITYDFPGGSGPFTPSGSAHGETVRVHMSIF